MIGILRHLFIPHHSNNHRSKLLHHKSLFGLILVIVILSAFTFTLRKTVPSILGVATNINVSDLLSYTNQKRQEQGSTSLVISEELSKAAAGKAVDMFAKDYWAHNAPDGTTPWVFVQAAGYNYIYAGENLAKDFDDSDGVVAAWMASPSHRENMLSAKYDEVGFAVVNGTLNGQETTLVVQMLGKKQPSEIAAAPPVQNTSQAKPVTPTVVPTVVPATPPPAGGPTSPSVELARTQEERPEPNFVAGITSNPLIDVTAFTRRFSLIVLAMIIVAFIADLLYIERRKLVRLVGHNADHILFLAGSFLVILFILGKGVIL